MRRANPDLFTRRNNLSICGNACQAYGNIHLLGNPFRDQVVIHKTDTPDRIAKLKEEWFYTATNGGVLVSPFISKKEKEIRSEAEIAGGRFILITHEAFGERYKPVARDFALCTQGRMLIISLRLPAKTPLTRDICLKMNFLAEAIAKGEG